MLKKPKYANYQGLQYYCIKNNITIKNSEYNEIITCYLQMSNSMKKKFLDDVDNKKLNIFEIKEEKDIMIFK